MSQSISVKSGDFISIAGKAKNLDITNMTIVCGAKYLKENTSSNYNCSNPYIEFVTTIVDATAVGGGLFKLEYDQILNGNLTVGTYICDVKIINNGKPVHTNQINIVVTEGVTK